MQHKLLKFILFGVFLSGQCLAKSTDRNQPMDMAADNSDFDGGQGAARQFCDLILQAQNLHQTLINRYSAT